MEVEMSIIMPAYNVANYIQEAIDSILAQSFGNFEFFIIDDGSKDDTRTIISDNAKKDARIIALKNDKNMGICHSLNRGILFSKGKYIVRMDADDISLPDRLQKQYDFMESHPHIGISSGTSLICDVEMKEISKRVYHEQDDIIRSKMFYYSPFTHASCIMRREHILGVGMYNPDLKDAEDYDMYFRMGRVTKFANLRDPLYKVRTYPQSVSQSRSRRQESLTLYIRIKAMMEYGYAPSVKHITFLASQFIGMYLIPQRWKFGLFNFFRSMTKHENNL